jgi:hypothetical protein
MPINSQNDTLAVILEVIWRVFFQAIWRMLRESNGPRVQESKPASNAPLERRPSRTPSPAIDQDEPSPGLSVQRPMIKIVSTNEGV